MKSIVIVICLCAWLCPVMGVAQNSKAEIPDSVAREPFADNSNHWYGIADKDRMIGPMPGRPRFQSKQLTEIGDNIILLQKSNGGWPQYYPLETNYSKEITFNDGAFEGIMQLLKDILNGVPQYDYLNAKYREKIEKAFTKGIECILKTQINDAGSPTAWCQQYDEQTLEPAWARKFEPPSISNGESSGVVLFLMSIDQPDGRIVGAVQNAVRWFQVSKIYNTRVVTIPAPRMETPFRISTTDRVVVVDSAAPPIWTRYYELKTHRPVFCNRDSKVVYSLAEVDRERRDGYQWYTYAPQKVLNMYPSWQKKWAPGDDVLMHKLK